MKKYVSYIVTVDEKKKNCLPIFHSYDSEFKTIYLAKVQIRDRLSKEILPAVYKISIEKLVKFERTCVILVVHHSCRSPLSSLSIK